MQGDYYQLPTGKVTALDDDTPFPPVNEALTEPNGLLAIGGDLSSERLLNAYRSGIFPWFSEGEPVLWWSPDPRMVLFPLDFKVSKSLAKRLKKNDYEVKFNTQFRQVMEACAQTSRPDQDGTWITSDIIDAYCELHQLGYAHSAETWVDNTLVGGLYGVLINKMFYGESMFHHVTDASKIAFAHLVDYLKAKEVGMIDCQMNTKHLTSLGAKEINRSEFMSKLNALI
jgi:leucyl/phenylalanyl-tRNA---protein transferase